MGIVRNAAVTYESIPEKYLVPGKTTKYVDTHTIDLDNVPLSGGFLVKILVLSSDPYLRVRMRPAHIESYFPAFVPGETIHNLGIGRVLRSEDPNFQVGDLLHGFYDFQEYSVCHAEKARYFPYTKVQRHPSLSLSLYVGTLGMPGCTAYMGWKAFAQEKALTAETLFVSTGAGPVGSLVIQLAKLTNPKLKVIASAGSRDKVEFMKSIGADIAFNYKEQSTGSVLDSEKHIDIYWDNVGGEVLDAALLHMSNFGLIVACGAISAYNGDPPAVKNYAEFYARNLKLQGFLLQPEYFSQFYAEVPALVIESKIKYREHRYDGLENAEQALLNVQTGGNIGKAVIIVASE